MKNYEVMYIIKPMAEDAFNALVVKFENIIKENGGEVSQTDSWGKKRLAYKIQDYTHGLYVLMAFKCDPEATKELHRVMDINQDVLRHMIIRKGDNL